MSKLDIIATVLEPAFLAEPPNKLVEQDLDHRGRPFQMARDIVSTQNVRHILYRFDPKKRDIFPFFSQTSGLKRICDYILFAEEGKSCWCLLIEMKMGSRNTDMHAQLAASEAFVRYVVDAARRIGKDILCEDVNFRKIGVSEYRKRKPGEREEEVVYDANGFLQLTSLALRLPALLR